jgi:N utilization substance protein B
MGSRRHSRELAVQLCYQWALDPKSLSDPKVIDRFWREQALSPAENRNFFEMIVKGVATHLPEIDAKIEHTLEKWKLSRLEKVDLAVLRVATWELAFSNDPEKPDTAVVIDEALEIAKKFGSGESSSFINGVLDALAKGGKSSTDTGR